MHLAIASGPRKGTEVPLRGESLLLGRGSQAALPIPDLAMSRRHASVQRSGAHWTIADLGSGNGTRVNGRRVRKARLRHGDEIVLGTTSLRFVDLDQPALPRQSPFLRRSWLALPVALALMATAVLLRGRAAPRPGAPEAASAVDGRIDAALERVRSGAFDEGRDALRGLSRTSPDPRAASALAAVEADAGNAQRLADATAALQRGDPGAAAAALAAIPASSLLAGPAAGLRARLAALSAPGRPSPAGTTSVARPERARPERVRPERARPAFSPPSTATALAHRPEPSLRDAKPVQVPGPASSPPQAGEIAAASPPSAPAQAVEKKPTPPGAASPEVEEILTLYRSGDVGGALDRAQAAPSAEARALAPQIGRASLALRTALARSADASSAEALRLLDIAASADAQVDGHGDGRIRRELSVARAALHVKLASPVETPDDRLRESAAHLRAASRLDPAGASVLEGQRILRERARELYLRGYMALKTDPEAARADFRLVCGVLPASDETAQKARQWLGQLEPGPGPAVETGGLP